MTAQWIPVSVTTQEGAWEGTLLAWRWIDEPEGNWTGLVRYQGPRGLQYEQWIPGAAVTRSYAPERMTRLKPLRALEAFYTGLETSSTGCSLEVSSNGKRVAT